MSDAEFAGLGITALVGVVFLLFLAIVLPQQPEEPTPSQAVEEAKRVSGLGFLKLIVVVVIFWLLFSF